MMKAMSHLVRELYSAVFTLSCRDAAEFAKESQHSGTNVSDGGADKDKECRLIPPAGFNACIPHVGIQCGLHDHSGSIASLSEQSDKLQHCINSMFVNPQLRFEKMLCPTDSSPLSPNVANREFICQGSLCKSLGAAASKKTTPVSNVAAGSTGGKISVGHAHAFCSKCTFSLCVDCVTGQEQKRPDFDAASQESFETIVNVCRLATPSKSKSKDEPLRERRVTIDLLELAGVS